jgi:hypothetical protein
MMFVFKVFAILSQLVEEFKIEAPSGFTRLCSLMDERLGLLEALIFMSASRASAVESRLGLSAIVSAMLIAQEADIIYTYALDCIF